MTLGASKIPKIIHQIWIGPDPVPPHCLKFIEEMKKLHPDWDYKLWGNEVFEDLYPDDPFFKNYLADTEVFKWAYIADRLRLLLLRDFGGVYCDVDAKPIRSFNLVGDQLGPGHTYFAGVRPIGQDSNEIPLIDCTVIGATKNSRMIKHCLSLYVDLFWAWMGRGLSDRMWPVMGPDVALFDYRYFYDKEITDKTIICHDAEDHRLWSWSNGRPCDEEGNDWENENANYTN